MLQKSRCRDVSPVSVGVESSEESKSETPGTEAEVSERPKQKVPFLVELKNSKNKPKLRSNKPTAGDPKKAESNGIQDQLRLKLEARKKLMEEAEEAADSPS